MTKIFKKPIMTRSRQTVTLQNKKELLHKIVRQV